MADKRTAEADAAERFVGLRAGAPDRTVTEIGPGDYVKVNGWWELVEWNTAFAVQSTPRRWFIRTGSGTRGMFEIERYAKAEDFA
jgi:hypothetical protein